MSLYCILTRSPTLARVLSGLVPVPCSPTYPCRLPRFQVAFQFRSLAPGGAGQRSTDRLPSAEFVLCLPGVQVVNAYMAHPGRHAEQYRVGASAVRYIFALSLLVFVQVSQEGKDGVRVLTRFPVGRVSKLTHRRCKQEIAVVQAARFVFVDALQGAFRVLARFVWKCTVRRRQAPNFRLDLQAGVVEENGQERGSNEVGICRDRWRPWLMDVSGQNVRLDQPHCEAKPDQFPIP